MHDLEMPAGTPAEQALLSCSHYARSCNAGTARPGEHDIARKFGSHTLAAHLLLELPESGAVMRVWQDQSQALSAT